MKTSIKFSLLAVCILLAACYNDNIIAFKPGEPINGNEISFTWGLPTSYPEGMIRPVLVQIVVAVDGIQEGGTIILPDNPSSFTNTVYDSDKAYRFILKVVANMDVQEAEPYVSDIWYSEGTTIGI
ncbi:DUF4945 domain-containing protein [Allomuricauda sp. CP2A]|jgi:hypothetical protein|uniref:DUF4945 domain-containing protein n=1 Tax=Allomuricauda sp. CP2A TaxID=1848189 RepID=UPI0008332C5F|nr:DUF4945 domain-containing protein [Muricauda sp. CP2A]